MKLRTVIPGWLLLGVVLTAPAFDSYQDSLAKYAAWHSRYGLGEVEGGRDGVRVERNVLASNLPIFRPHRPRVGGKQFQVSAVSAVPVVDLGLGLGSLDQELSGPSTFRGTRHNHAQAGLGGGEYLSSLGTPLYKLKKRFPLGYGRKKRSAASPWQLLDPATGRPLGSNTNDRVDESLDFYHQELAARPRPERGSSGFRFTQPDFNESPDYNAYVDPRTGTPIYKLRKRNPLGYGR